MTATMKQVTVRCVRAASVILPIVFLACSRLQLTGPLNVVLQAMGTIGMLVIPGYTLLWAVGLLAGSKHTYRWALVVPLSLGVDTLLGIVLVMTPIGLTRLSLWTTLSIWAVLTSAVGSLRT